MTRDDFKRKIRQSWSFLRSELDLGRTVSSLESLSVSKPFNETALDKSSTYKEIYTTAVSNSYYNFMLHDYAVFQYSWKSNSSWRLSYLPNPWLSGVQEAERTVAEWEALESLGGLNEDTIANLISEMPCQHAIPPIRFEYAAHQYREIAHPAAHLHIGRHADNRWALSRLLDPLTFTMMVLRLYYSARWTLASSFHGASESTCVERRFISELSKMRLVHQFSVDERRSLHLAAQ